MARKKRGAKLPLPIALLLALLLAGAYYYFQPALPTAPPLALPTVPEPSALTGPSAPPAELQTENWAAGQGLVTLHSIDVGQGDATLLVFPNGKTLLVDAGNNGKGKAIILPYFEKLGIEQIDWLVATNPDADHVGGMDDVINEIPVKNFLDPGVACATKTCLANDAALARAGITKTFAHRGEALNLGDGFKVGILNPVKPLAFDKENNNSIVLFVDTQGKDFLLPGDCEKECEAQLVEAYGDKLKAGLYKAGHHGSRTSSSEAFLDKIRPTLAIVSAGEGNQYGHPHPETLEKFKDRGIRVLRTDELGTIVVHSDPAQGCCTECRENLSRDPRGVGPEGIACASYGNQLSLLCRKQFESAPKNAAECLAT